MQNSRVLFWAFIITSIIGAIAIVAAALILRQPPSPPLSPATATSLPVETLPEPTSCNDGEHLVAAFDRGQFAVQTNNSYSGQVLITVSGSGQASGAEYTDAFYTFTDFEGNEVFPYVYGFYLMINGKRADEFIPGRQVPPYSADHVYSFSIEAPGGVLSFGVDDEYTADNAGSYQVEVCRQ
jgi:hypothetical protein